jgi:hypothetical protein
MKYTSQEVIDILKKIFDEAGYNATFEGVNIDLKDKDFTIRGNAIVIS